MCICFGGFSGTFPKKAGQDSKGKILGNQFPRIFGHPKSVGWKSKEAIHPPRKHAQKIQV